MNKNIIIKNIKQCNNIQENVYKVELQINTTIWHWKTQPRYKIDIDTSSILQFLSIRMLIFISPPYVHKYCTTGTAQLALNPIPFHSLGLLYITKGTNDIPSSTYDNVCFVCKFVVINLCSTFLAGKYHVSLCSNHFFIHVLYYTI
jgi:hypothetical protein